jgi:hypothetical protein
MNASKPILRALCALTMLLEMLPEQPTEAVQLAAAGNRLPMSKIIFSCPEHPISTSDSGRKL